MRLDKILLLTLFLLPLTFLLGAFSSTVIESVVLSSIMLVVATSSFFILWLLPTVIVLLNKEMDNRLFISCLSLFLPATGGLFAYFLIRKELNKLEKL